MSHFSCLVFHEEGENVGDMLAPWMENCCGEPERKYMEFYEDDDCDVDPDTGKRGYWQNPNAKWDWFAVGEYSRWNGTLRLKDGGRADSARIGDVDFSPDKEMFEAARSWWEKAIEEKLAEGEENPFPPIPSKEHFLKAYPGGAEQYARSMAAFSTYAVVKDGEWHAQGRMLWFGLSDEGEGASRAWGDAFFDAFLRDADPDLWVTVVDCHI